jgi:hypothetical protein
MYVSTLGLRYWNTRVQNLYAIGLCLAPNQLFFGKSFIFWAETPRGILQWHSITHALRHYLYLWLSRYSTTFLSRQISFLSLHRSLDWKWTSGDLLVLLTMAKFRVTPETRTILRQLFSAVPTIPHRSHRWYHFQHIQANSNSPYGRLRCWSQNVPQYSAVIVSLSLVWPKALPGTPYY